MQRRYDKILSHESGVLIYNSNNIKIYKEVNGDIYFESNIIDLTTNDCAELVSAILRIKEINDYKFWNIKIENKYNISAENALYWITGGDKEWNNNISRYKYKWDELCDIFYHRYSDIIYDIVDRSESLGDIRDGLIKEIRLDDIYEFSLDNDLI